MYRGCPSESSRGFTVTTAPVDVTAVVGSRARVSVESSSAVDVVCTALILSTPSTVTLSWSQATTPLFRRLDAGLTCE